MLNENFVYVSIILSSIGGAIYLYLTLKGKVKPNKVTWFLWGAIPMIAFFAQIKEGVGIQSLLTFMVGFIPFLIFFTSFLNRKAFWKITKFDIICGLFSILGVIFWLATGVGVLAILFSIIADAIAGIPTVVKSIKEPETESYIAFALTTIGTIITLLTIDNWNFATYSFPIYLLIINAFLALIIWSKIGKRFTS
ncbi:MAG: hypothetical protein KBD51_00770 [Candidatus Levybacteria bacterium]|nr:hypothetical protein [Candidatus Levybacteria bacterium]